MRIPSLLLGACLLAAPALHAIPRLRLPESGVKIERAARHGSYYDAVGEKAGVYGMESGPMEAWVYPTKVFSDFRLTFRPPGAGREIPQEEVEQSITVRPESVTLHYAHPLFSVRETVFVPHDQAAAVLLFEVASPRGLRIGAHFRPQMLPAWPAGGPRAEAFWDDQRKTLLLRGGDSRITLAAPGWRFVPHDWPVDDPVEHPLDFETDIAPADALHSMQALVLAPDAPSAAALLSGIAPVYAHDVQYYREFLGSTVRIETPDPGLNQAFDWARLEIRRGLVEVPGLGRGLVAGYRCSGVTERPGFAWFFGRDQMWTALALDAYGDFAAARTAMDFLRRYQRADGKIPHEVAQSAKLVNWFRDYPYPWASADSTPLFIVAHDDYWRASADQAYIRAAWPSLLNAYRYALSLDTDDDGLLENSAGGHGWVEGGLLLPAKEEIYLQGVWVQALLSLANMADTALDPSAENRQFAADCRRRAALVRARIEQVYWLAPAGPQPGHYAFGTQPVYAFGVQPASALTREVTVLPAVPMWWRLLDPAHGRQMLQSVAASGLLTDWGTRIVTRASALYDGTSYHYGSVWPLFTGWAAMAAFRYGRADLGYTLLRQNAQLTYDFSPGAVTELLSGDFYLPTVQSTHHQIWSSAMVATPALRGLLGIEPDVPARTLRLEPQLPPGWAHAAARNVPFGDTKLDVEYSRSGGVLEAVVKGEKLSGRLVVVAPGTGQEHQVALTTPETRVKLPLPDAAEPWVDFEPGEVGSAARGLRLLGWETSGDTLTITVEGVQGRSYRLAVFTRRAVEQADAARVLETNEDRVILGVDFAAPPESTQPDYARTQVKLRLAAARARKATHRR